MKESEENIMATRTFTSNYVLNQKEFEQMEIALEKSTPALETLHEAPKHKKADKATIERLRKAYSK